MRIVCFFFIYNLYINKETLDYLNRIAILFINVFYTL